MGWVLGNPENIIIGPSRWLPHTDMGSKFTTVISEHVVAAA